MPAVRPAVKSAFFLACLAALTGTYFLNTPLPLFQTRLKEVILALAILLSAGGWGARLLQALRPSALNTFEEFLFAETIGLGLLSTGMFFLGVLGGWNPGGAWTLIVVGWVGSGPFLLTLRRFLQNESNPPSHSTEFFWRLLVVMGGVWSFLWALAPITYYDSLVYHLALPAAYIQAHHWIGLPGLIYSAFPQTLEMLWTLALLIGDDTVVNLVSWAMSLLLIGAVVAFARRYFDHSVGWIAAALLAVMPAFLLLSSGGYIDIGLTLFCFMALYAACVWRDHPASSLLTMSGLMAGWAAGTKYTGALPALLIAGFLGVWLYRKSGEHVLTGWLIYGFSALAVLSPWLIKNLHYVGNPVFPFFYRWGLNELNPWLNQAASGYFNGLTEYAPHSLWQLPGVLWDAAVNGVGFGRGIDVLGDYGWLPLLSFLPALWLCRQRPSRLKFLLLFCGLYFIPWAMSRPVLRFLLPISPLLALLTAYAWVNGIRTQPATLRWLARGFFASFLLSGLFILFYTTSIISSLGAALGIEARPFFLSRTLNYYSAASFVNTETPRDSQVVVLGDQRGYYYQRPVWISPAFSKTPLVEWANTAASPEALRQHLRDQGITHVLVNRTEMERLKVYHTSTFNEVGQRNWNRLQSGLMKLLFHDTSCDVYAL